MFDYFFLCLLNNMPSFINIWKTYFSLPQERELQEMMEESSESEEEEEDMEVLEKDREEQQHLNR